MNITVSLRSILLLDALFEFAAGAALIVFASTLGDWLRIGATASIVLGVVFIAAGVAIMLLRARPDASTLRALAWANVIGGAAGWVVLIAFWPQLDTGGRFVLGIASDAFIAIGVLELLALRERSSIPAA